MFVKHILIALLFRYVNCQVYIDKIDPRSAFPSAENSCLSVIASLTAAFSASCGSKPGASTKIETIYEEIPYEYYQNQTDEVEQNPLASFARNCYDLQQKGDNQSGIGTIYPFKESPFWGTEVLCDQHTDDGGWTVFQIRDDLSLREDFYRTWLEYSLGFGNLSGEHWMGLNDLHSLTNSLPMELRIELENEVGERRFAKYGFFSVANSAEKFRLSVGRYGGNAGDSFGGHNSFMFSTHDRDNDVFKGNCAEKYRGGWWYGACHSSNLNGHHYVGDHESTADGINWEHFEGFKNSMKKTSMMVRPSFRKLN